KHREAYFSERRVALDGAGDGGIGVHARRFAHCERKGRERNEGHGQPRSGGRAEAGEGDPGEGRARRKGEQIDHGPQIELASFEDAEDREWPRSVSPSVADGNAPPDEREPERERSNTVDDGIDEVGVREQSAERSRRREGDSDEDDK